VASADLQHVRVGGRSPSSPSPVITTPSPSRHQPAQRQPAALP